MSTLMACRVLDLFKAAGFCLGQLEMRRLDGTLAWRLDALGKDGHRCIVAHEEYYSAAVLLAEQAGVELEE